MHACTALTPQCVSGRGLNLDGEQRRNKFRNAKQTLAELRTQQKNADWQSTVEGLEVKRERRRESETKKQREREKEREKGEREGGGQQDET